MSSTTSGLTGTCAHSESQFFQLALKTFTIVWAMQSAGVLLIHVRRLRLVWRANFRRGGEWCMRVEIENFGVVLLVVGHHDQALVHCNCNDCKLPQRPALRSPEPSADRTPLLSSVRHAKHTQVLLQASVVPYTQGFEFSCTKRVGAASTCGGRVHCRVGKASFMHTAF